MDPSHWPVKTELHFSDKGSLKLTNQNKIVRKAISDSFTVLHTSIIFLHAFPDALLSATFIQQVLLTATSRLPGATEIRKRILIDHGYYMKMSILVRLILYFVGSVINIL